MDLFLWELARASGLAAYAAVCIAVITGLAPRTAALAFLARNRAVRGLHDFSPLLVLPLSALHAVALLLDATARISVRDLLVPFVASYGQLAIGLGTISLDLLVVVLVTTWLRPRMSNRVWQLFHRLSYVAFVALFFHSILSGTDLTSPVIAGLAWIAALIVAYYSLERVLGSLMQPESSRARA